MKKNFALVPVQLYLPKQTIRFGLINVFIFIGLIRLTNVNYYLSKLLGFETTVNATGGDAVNFSNYAGTLLLVYILYSKLHRSPLNWFSIWPYAVLFAIYSLNIFLAPYSDFSWYMYQMVFLSVALVLHLYTERVAYNFSERLQKGIQVLFWSCVVLNIAVLCIVLSQVSLSYYISYYNDAFVHALDDYGIMKQRFGYLAGFLMSYALFIIKKQGPRILVLIVVFAACFGIRSFLIGLAGAGFIFSIRNPKALFFWGLGVVLAFGLLWQGYFNNLLYDTRYYSFLNGYDIIQKFPFGVGLGGYPIYTEEFSRRLFASFYDINAILDFIPTAPESDFVHVFGSLGLALGLVHLCIQGRIIWLSVVWQKYFTPFHKCILFYFCFMTFFGISEDSMFSINYWIFFGISTGILVAVEQYKKIAKLDG